MGIAQQPHQIEAVAEAIYTEISRISRTENVQTRIDHDAISGRNAPIDWSLTGPLEILGPAEATVGHTEFDERPRFHRLADRHDAMIANGIPDLDEYRRVHAELFHLMQDDYRVAPRRLFGDGPYPWDEAAAEKGTAGPACARGPQPLRFPLALWHNWRRNLRQRRPTQR